MVHESPAYDVHRRLGEAPHCNKGKAGTTHADSGQAFFLKDSKSLQPAIQRSCCRRKPTGVSSAIPLRIRKATLTPSPQTPLRNALCTEAAAMQALRLMLSPCLAAPCISSVILAEGRTNACPFLTEPCWSWFKRTQKGNTQLVSVCVRVFWCPCSETNPNALARRHLDPSAMPCECVGRIFVPFLGQWIWGPFEKVTLLAVHLLSTHPPELCPHGFISWWKSRPDGQIVSKETGLGWFETGVQ